MSIGNRIRYIRDSLSQPKFAKEIGMKRNTVPAMEAGISGHVWLLEEIVALTD